ncbi:MAG: ROK family protein [Chloroflexota bacterium]|nr:ROK family protein [Chloroflexota bacterium]
MNEQLILALDVGGSSVKSALIEMGQRIVDDVRVDVIQSESSVSGILHTLAGIIDYQLGKSGGLNKTAIAFPGPFDYEQGICLIQNQGKYDALYGLPLGKKLKEILNLPALEFRYRNDAEAAVLGETLYGAGVPYSRLLGVTLGTGLGTTFVAGGLPITKGDTVPPHGWLYSCLFKQQRADDVFSTRGLLARLREHGIHAADIASAVQNTDIDPLLEVFASFGSDLGLFLKPFVSNFGADAVLVTGGIAETWEYFAPSLTHSLPIPVLKGTLGKRAALLGASALYHQG